MDNNLLNQVLKNLVSRTNFSSLDFKSQVLAKAITQENEKRPSPTDSLSHSSSSEQFLENSHLPIEEENLKIANAFLNKGFIPTKEEFEAVKQILQKIPNKQDLSKLLELAVNLTIQGIDINNEIIQESISIGIDEEKIQKVFQEIKAEVIKDKTIPANIRLDISNEIDQIKTQLQQVSATEEPLPAPNSDDSIIGRLKTAIHQSPEFKLQKIIEIASHGLEKINNIVADGVSHQIQNDDLLHLTNELHDKIEKIKNATTINRQSLIDSINTTTNELSNLKENIQKTTTSLVSNNQTNYQSIMAAFQEETTTFLKLLNTSDAILEKFGDFISVFPQSLKLKNDSSPQSISPNEVPASNPFLVADNQKTPELGIVTKLATDVQAEINNFTKKIDDTLNTVKNVNSNNFTANTFNEPAQLPSANPLLKGFNENSSSLVLPNKIGDPKPLAIFQQIFELTESIKNNLQAIKQAITDTAEMPASLSLKAITKILQDAKLDVFKMFEKLNLDAKNFPETNKMQAQWLLDKTKNNTTPAEHHINQGEVNSGTSKIVNLGAFIEEIESMENEYFKTNDTIQNLKKIHDIVSKSETKLAVQQLLEKASFKPESFHAFELSINPMQEMKPTRVEVQQKQQTEELIIKKVFHISIDVDLSQTGAVKAQLYSADKIKQIFINFEDNKFRNKAIENLEDLQNQLKEIPFISQIFFSKFAEPTHQDIDFSQPDLNPKKNELNLDTFA